jgi:hypothetical protein
MRLVLDSGAFIALERNDRAMWRRLKAALIAREIPVSHGGVVGQVWRGKGARQAPSPRGATSNSFAPEPGTTPSSLGSHVD